MHLRRKQVKKKHYLQKGFGLIQATVGVPSPVKEHESSFPLFMSKEKDCSATVRYMMLALSGSRAPMCGVSSPDK